MFQQKNIVEGLILLDLKTYYRTIVIKILGYGYQERHIYEWKRIRNIQKSQNLYNPLVFGKVVKINEK